LAFWKFIEIMSLTLRCRDRKDRDKGTLELRADATVANLKDEFAKKNSKYGPERQWWTAFDGKTVLKSNETKLVDLGLKNNDIIVFKDLGFQIGYRTVFLVEYFGPILAHTICYCSCSQALIYGKTFEHQLVQKIAYWLVMFHYVKRELETVFIHRFSNDTMPIRNIFKNSAHYWLLGGLFISYFLYHPEFTAPQSMAVIYSCVAVFIIAEFGNLWAHMVLRDLRPPGTRRRAIPRGGMFEIVSCANYTFEILAWFTFSILTQVLTAHVFLLVSVGQIAQWSLKKHKAYLAEFPEYKNLKRYILFPFIW